MKHLPITLFLLLGLFVGAVAADDAADEDHEQARRLKELGKILPLEQIIKAAQVEHPGRVIEVDLEKEDGRHIYEVELLDAHGEVWELQFDAASGKLIKRERED